jgi:hypothetical protein
MKELKELPHQHDQLRASHGPDYGEQSESDFLDGRHAERSLG